MKTLIISDFSKEKDCNFRGIISLWGKEKVRLWVDIPEVEHSTLEQYIDAVNQKVSWIVFLFM